MYIFCRWRDREGIWRWMVVYVCVCGCVSLMNRFWSVCSRGRGCICLIPLRRLTCFASLHCCSLTFFGSFCVSDEPSTFHLACVRVRFFLVFHRIVAGPTYTHTQETSTQFRAEGKMDGAMEKSVSVCAEHIYARKTNRKVVTATTAMPESDGKK